MMAPELGAPMALGGRGLRVLALSPKGTVKLTFSARGHSTSRAIAVG